VKKKEKKRGKKENAALNKGKEKKLSSEGSGKI